MGEIGGVTIGLIVLATMTLAYGIWWLWWQLPKRQTDRLALKIRDPKARADVEDNIRKTIGQALGGVAVLIGAGFALFQFLQQQQAAHDLLISNQVSKGFEQFASKEPLMRLGGIYALEGVMNGSEQYRMPVLEALCAFVRDNTIMLDQEKLDQRPTTEVQAVLTVIGRRADSSSGGIVNLENARIAHAQLVDAHLQYAQLTGAKLGSADLSLADLHGAVLVKTDLNHSDLSGADLHGAHLDGTDLSGAHLNSANLRDALAYGAPINLTGADLTAANLTGVNLTKAYLVGANLTNAELMSAHLAGADLSLGIARNAYWTGADLTGANLNGADLTVTLNIDPISQAQLDRACGEGAKLPAGLTLKPCPETQSKAQ